MQGRGGMLLHLVAHTLPGTVAFRTWVEARALWDRVVPAVPGLVALVLMPDHLHLLHGADVRRPLAAALSGYARWRNHQRGERGPLFHPVPPPEELVDDDKVRRSIRYVALNPCRARLVADPLAWPFSSYRDSVGLAVPSVRRPDGDPHELHAYVSADPTVDVRGSALPVAPHQVPTPEAVAHAVSALTRTPLGGLRRRGPARRLFLRAAKALCPCSGRDLARLAGCSDSAVAHAPSALDAEVRLVARVVDDPRFDALFEGDLRATPGWRRYRGRR